MDQRMRCDGAVAEWPMHAVLRVVIANAVLRRCIAALLNAMLRQSPPKRISVRWIYNSTAVGSQGKAFHSGVCRCAAGWLHRSAIAEAAVRLVHDWYKVKGRVAAGRQITANRNDQSQYCSTLRRVLSHEYCSAD
jgi:hypothetical protein